MVRDRLLRSTLRTLAHVNFEMHAIDLLDASDHGIPSTLRDAQPDLRVPAAEKIDAFRTLFLRLKTQCDVRTLADTARSLAIG